MTASHDRMVGEPQETRQEADQLCRLSRLLLVELDLTGTYGLAVRRVPGMRQWGVYVGRHDNGPMPRDGLRAWPDGARPGPPGHRD